MKKADRVLHALVKLEERYNKGISAREIGEEIDLDRANVSRYLNKLYKEKKISKSIGRPVLYYSIKEESSVENNKKNSFDRVLLQQQSLQVPIQKAKAAILYPPTGLHTLILGETGVGKTMFAELMHNFAVESNVLSSEAPFIRFNCADYADNPQLVISQIFGVKKGAYTGAENDREGLLNKADGGILFLDEVHRLSAQGQEMLFTYIDKGQFRPLGETVKTISVNVQIIAATTEEPNSYLLKTFTRRIPMIITLPPLREKSLAERYYLIDYFFKKESKRIGKSIYINKQSFISLLLYQCPNNIGQLASDIQLCCAKAFVHYKSKKENHILITTSDLPQHVKKGLLRLNEYRAEVEEIMQVKGEILRFSFKEDIQYHTKDDNVANEDFYEGIARRLDDLKSSGLTEGEINQTINIDIEAHFQKYLGNLDRNLKKKDISKVVDLEVLESVEQILNLAEKRLNTTYDIKIYYGLALHIHNFIERMKKGLKVYHPKLNLIRADYPEEFMVALEAVNIIDKRFEIQTPLDEIGYITLFLIKNVLDLEYGQKSKVGILVMMHGRTTASSMVEVCNTLVGENHAVALDMPLNMKPEEIYLLAKERVINLNQGQGVMLLVDMGSLVSYGDMIYEDTGVNVRTVDMVSTPLLLEACRKAVLGWDMNEIYESLIDVGKFKQKNSRKKTIKAKRVIITACFTGEGAAEHLQNIIETELAKKYNFAVIPLNILNRKEFLNSVNSYKKKYKILAIVSTVGIDMVDIPYISAAELIDGSGINALERILGTDDNYIKIGDSLHKHLKQVDGAELSEEIMQVISNIEGRLEIKVCDEIAIGMMMHTCFLIEKLKKGEKGKVFKELQLYKNQYNREMGIIKECFKVIEKKYNINILEDEIGYICKILLLNSQWAEN
ncbi:sigma 54-interacting transcriptional regulator [Proteinivorax tanatarense]|uniref:Sigma 54-interacting transcriptional regulator n=1 Tax=Proteinivorax tanatarense TaxID=1260629 RepID=A0AAU7VMP8_9FIRM